MYHLDLLTKEKINVNQLSDDAQFKIERYKKLTPILKASEAKKVQDEPTLRTIANIKREQEILNKDVCREIYGFLEERDAEANKEKERLEAEAKAKAEADAAEAAKLEAERIAKEKEQNETENRPFFKRFVNW